MSSHKEKREREKTLAKAAQEAEKVRVKAAEEAATLAKANVKALTKQELRHIAKAKELEEKEAKIDQARANLEAERAKLDERRAAEGETLDPNDKVSKEEHEAAQAAAHGVQRGLEEQVKALTAQLQTEASRAAAEEAHQGGDQNSALAASMRDQVRQQQLATHKVTMLQDYGQMGPWINAWLAAYAADPSITDRKEIWGWLSDEMKALVESKLNGEGTAWTQMGAKQLLEHIRKEFKLGKEETSTFLPTLAIRQTVTSLEHYNGSNEKVVNQWVMRVITLMMGIHMEAMGAADKAKLLVRELLSVMKHNEVLQLMLHELSQELNEKEMQVDEPGDADSEDESEKQRPTRLANKTIVEFYGLVLRKAREWSKIKEKATLITKAEEKQAEKKRKGSTRTGGEGAGPSNKKQKSDGNSGGQRDKGAQGKGPSTTKTSGGFNSDNKVLCKGCGKPHGTSACRLAEHPDRNTEDKPWADSKMGKAWAAAEPAGTWKSLPYNKRLDRGQAKDFSLTSGGKQQGGGASQRGKPSEHQTGEPTAAASNLHALSDQQRVEGKAAEDDILSPQDLIGFEDGTVLGELLTTEPLTGVKVTLPVRVLIDTGSDSCNFMAACSLEALTRQGCVRVEPCYKRVKVGQTVLIAEQQVSATISLTNKEVGLSGEIVLDFYVLDIDHDIIIGRPAIRAHAVMKSILFSDLIDDSDLDWILTLMQGKAPSSVEVPATHAAKLAAVQTRLRTLEESAHTQAKIQAAVEEERRQLQALLDEHYPEEGARVGLWRRQCRHNRRNSATVKREIAELYALRCNAQEDTQDADASAAARADTDSELPENIQGTEEQRAELKELCAQYSDCFSSKLRREPARIPPMHLDVADNWDTRENRRSPRPQGRGKEQEIDEQTDKMREAEVIRLSTASAHSQVLLTPKPDGTWRFCVDYRRLNASTRSESWPIPNIPKMLRGIGEKRPRFFGVLDLTKGYYQAPLSESSKHYTAFITAKALYEWNRVPMGLMGAPAYFQRIMTTIVLAGLMFNSCDVYMDDIIVYGHTWEEYVANVAKVLQRLRKYGLTANPKKTKLGLEKVEYVGHTIDSEGITYDRKRLQEVIDFQRPETLGELKSFIGLANYVRDNVPHASDFAVKLNEMLNGYTKARSKWKTPWTAESDQAFTDLKAAINDCQKLFWLDESSPIHLYTDASAYGIGAYLYQLVDGKERPVAFMSRTLTKTQRAWSVPEKEAFAIYEAFRKFEYLLRDVHFHLHTDHQNLIYIRDTGSSKVIGWKIRVQEYDFEVSHVPGELNEFADKMSRNEAAKVMEEEPDDYTVTDLNTMYLGEEAQVTDLASLPLQENLFARKEAEGLKEAKQPIAHLCAFDGTSSTEQQKLIALAHNATVGHQGVEPTLGKLRKMGHKWKYMRPMVEQYVRRCDLCQKNDNRRMAYDVELFTTTGMSLMTERAVDFIGPLQEDEDGNKYMCSIIDTFSRWVELYPCKTDSALAAANALLQHYGRFGSPRAIRSDRGSAFVNSLIKQFHEKVGVKHDLSVAHSHEENSMIESANAEVRRYMNDICYDRRLAPGEWRDNIPIIMRIQNTTVKSMTGVSPAYMLYAGAIDLDHAVLPQDEQRQSLQKHVVEHSQQSWGEWMEQRQAAQRVAIELAQLNTREAQVKHLQEDGGARTEFPVGSWVLKRHPDSKYGSGKPNKQTLTWNGPYKVLKFKGSTYTLQDTNAAKQLEPCNIHLLKKFVYDPATVDPVEVRAKDTTDTYVVEAVLGHEGSWKKKGQLTFKVKWEGYPEITREPWQAMRANELTHQYMRANGHAHDIPAQFR